MGRSVHRHHRRVLADHDLLHRRDPARHGRDLVPEHRLRGRLLDPHLVTGGLVRARRIGGLRGHLDQRLAGRPSHSQGSASPLLARRLPRPLQHGPLHRRWRGRLRKRTVRQPAQAAGLFGRGLRRGSRHQQARLLDDARHRDTRRPGSRRLALQRLGDHPALRPPGRVRPERPELQPGHRLLHLPAAVLPTRAVLREHRPAGLDRRGRHPISRCRGVGSPAFDALPGPPRPAGDALSVVDRNRLPAGPLRARVQRPEHDIHGRELRRRERQVPGLQRHDRDRRLCRLHSSSGLPTPAGECRCF